ncbi:hypothetical protein VKT23_005849 [Stygiomarasmius scandens]|uniref:Uncharacterized protein n=1 Tax=Marasmiellus scandens TaxID=2682957 RepID=A0ABR1JU81_9AGAR
MYLRLLRVVLVALCVSSSLAAPNPLPTSRSSTKGVTSHSSTSSARTGPTTSTSSNTRGGPSSTIGGSTSGTATSGTSSSSSANPSSTGKTTCPARTGSSSSNSKSGKISARDGTTICGVTIRKNAVCDGKIKFDRLAGPGSSSSQSQSQSQSPNRGGGNNSNSGGSNNGGSNDGGSNNGDEDTSMPDAPNSSDADDERESSSSLSDPPNTDSQEGNSDRPPSAGSGNSGNTGNSGTGSDPSDPSQNNRPSDGDFDPDQESPERSSDQQVLESYQCEHTIELQFVKAAVEGAEICDLLDDLDITASQKETFIKTLITDQLLYSKKNLYDVVASVNGEKRRLTAQFIKYIDSTNIPKVSDLNNPEKAGLWISIKMYITNSRVASNVRSLVAPLDTAIEKIVTDAAGCAGPQAKSAAKTKAQNFNMPTKYKIATLWPKYVKYVEDQAKLDPSSESSQSDNNGGGSQGSAPMDTSSD